MVVVGGGRGGDRRGGVGRRRLGRGGEVVVGGVGRGEGLALLATAAIAGNLGGGLVVLGGAVRDLDCPAAAAARLRGCQ